MPSSKKLTIRKFAVYICSIALLLLAQPHKIFFPIGLVLIAIGEFLRIWACGHLRKNQDVICSGPFAYVKNPLYVGTFFIVTGLCLIASNPEAYSRYLLYIGYPLFLVVFVFYYFPYKVRVEGDRLRKRFGEKFDHYDKNVPNFIPRFSRYKQATNQPWDMKLLSENSEYGTMIWVLIGCLVIFSRFFFWTS